MPEFTPEELKAKIDKILAELNELDEKLGRQHGKRGQTFKGYTIEEYTRLNNNLISRKARARRKDLEAHQDRYIKQLYQGADDADQWGIRPRERRIYAKCFKSAPIGSNVELAYIKRMTGLSLMQIYILQQQTGKIPTPAVSPKVAKADQKRRWERGDYL